MMHKKLLLGTANNRKGAVAPFVATLLVGIFAMVAFAVDIGYICFARTELQRSADSCALAAVAKLPNLSEALSAAKARRWKTRDHAARN